MAAIMKGLETKSSMYYSRKNGNCLFEFKLQNEREDDKYTGKTNERQGKGGVSGRMQDNKDGEAGRSTISKTVQPREGETAS